MRKFIINRLWDAVAYLLKRESDLSHYGWGGTAWTQPILPPAHRQRHDH